MKICINQKGFTLIEILIAVVILELITIATATIFLHINKTNIKASKNYEMIKIAQIYMEEIKCNHIAVGNKYYSIEALEDKEIKFQKVPYAIILKIHHTHYDGLYKVNIEVKDKKNNIYILENYINTLKNDCYDEISIKKEELVP
ncbi:type IV pilus modification PilV family protein [Crassaminicella indica]|uniref:Type II secretion system GspH family protein n=1 Tax=Crassaminicella indica TaxID=2855394 RepID=A0ABX8RAC6_9CLOT|nr:type II secretion system protein [Crassaminicella indica]QXM06008.1 type II secretion system GspH family protein [Crassaminicella indica]